MSDFNNSNTGDQPQGQPRPRTLLDHFGMKLTTKPINGSTRRPSLAIRIVKNMPIISVFTNVEGDKDNGKIEVKLDQATFFAVIGAIRKMAASPGEDRIVVEKRDFKFMGGGKRSEEPMLEAKLAIGKDNTGVVYIAVASWDNSRPNVRFPFLPGGHSTFHNLAGEKLSEAELSVLMAGGYADAMSKVVAQLLVSNYVDEPPKQRPGGQGGGGNYNRGGQGGNYNRGGGYNNNGGGGGGNYNRGGGADWNNRSGGGNDSGFNENTHSFSDDIPM